jgi:hypothetical protein
VTATEVDRQIGMAPRRLAEDEDPREWVARRIAWRKLLVEKWRSEIEGTQRWEYLLRGAECRLVVARLTAELQGSIELPPSAVDAELERQRRIAAARQEVLRVRHIFRRADDAMSESEREAQRAVAEHLLARVRKGESFEELAREYSESETARNGGLLDGVRRGLLDEDFERAVFALDKGELSDVISTRRGYHIVRLEERFTPPPFVDDEVRPLVVSQLRHDAFRQQRAALVSELKATGTYFAGWNAAGELQPDANGVVFKIGDVSLSAEDVEGMTGAAPAVKDAARSPAQGLNRLLETELLCQEGLKRGVVGEEELSAERARLQAELLQRTAEAHELHRLRGAVTENELRRFIAEYPRRVAVPGDIRVLVLAFGYLEPQAYRAVVGARQLVERARGGEDLPGLGRRLADELGLEMVEEIAAMPPQRAAKFSPEVARAISSLRPGEVSDVIRLEFGRIDLIEGPHDGALVIARLLDREPERTLDFETEADELRRRYWKRFGAAIVNGAQEQALAEAGFELLEAH